MKAYNVVNGECLNDYGKVKTVSHLTKLSGLGLKLHKREDGDYAFNVYNTVDVLNFQELASKLTPLRDGKDVVVYDGRGKIGNVTLLKVVLKDFKQDSCDVLVEYEENGKIDFVSMWAVSNESVAFVHEHEKRYND